MKLIMCQGCFRFRKPKVCPYCKPTFTSVGQMTIEELKTDDLDWWFRLRQSSIFSPYRLHDKKRLKRALNIRCR